MLWLLTCSTLAFGQGEKEIEFLIFGFTTSTNHVPHLKIQYDNYTILDLRFYNYNGYSQGVFVPYTENNKPHFYFYADNDANEYKEVLIEWDKLITHRGTTLHNPNFSLNNYLYNIQTLLMPYAQKLFVSHHYCVGKPLSYDCTESFEDYLNYIDNWFKDLNIDPQTIGFERNPTVMVSLNKDEPWKVLCKTEKETPIPYETISEFFAKNYYKNLEDEPVEFVLKLKYGDYFETPEYNTAYYPQVKYNEGQAPFLNSNEDKVLTINIPEYDKKSLEVSIWNGEDCNIWNGEDCKTIKPEENDSYMIELRRKSNQGPSCPLYHYFNIFKVEKNQIDGYDFWNEEESQNGRAGAIVLSSKMSVRNIISPPSISINDGTEIQPTKITIPNKPDEYKYYLPQKLCTAGEHTIKIKYTNSTFLSHSLTYTLDENTLSDQIKTTAPICSTECSISIPVQNDNEWHYKIGDKEQSLPKEKTILADGNTVIQFKYKKDYIGAYIVPNLTPTEPSFSYENTYIKCNGGNITPKVIITNYSNQLTYSYSIEGTSTFNEIPSSTNEENKYTLQKLTADKDPYTINWKIKQGNNTCFENIQTTLKITQPTEDISFDVSTLPTTCKDSNDGEIIISNLKGGNGGAYTFWMGDNELTKDNSKLKISKKENDEVDYILTNNFYSSNKEDGEQTDYVVTVKDREGCAKSSENISIDFQTPQMNLTTTAASCELAENGQAVFKRSNRFNPNQIFWYKSNEKQDVLSPSMVNAEDGLLEHKTLFPGWYKVIFQDTKTQCSCNSTFEIVFNTYSFSSSTGNASCAAAPNGSAEISATISTTEGNKQGEFNPTCYSWTLQKNQSNKNITEHTSTTNTISGLLPGIYKVEINHDENCTSSTEVVIGTNTYNFLGTQYHDLSCVDASNGYITAQINKSGNGDFKINSYQWHVKPHGSFNNSSQDKNIFYLSGINEGEYTLVIKHDDYCTESTTVNISVNDYEWTTNHLNLSCKEVSNGYISATINRKDDFNGVFKINKYSWTVADTTYKSGENPANEKDGTYSFELTDLAPGLYKLSLTHDEKCTESTTVNIDVNDYYHYVTTTNAPCADIPSATATAVTNILSGTPESFHPHYIWTIKNGEPVPTGSDNFITERYSGDYNVRLEWEGGCYTEINFDIKHDTLRPSFLTTHAECADKQSIGGKVEINMSPERTYRYIWDDDTEGTEYNIAENLAAGSHTVKIFDQHNCSIIESFNILNNDFSVNVKSENALCRQDATGKVTFDIKGGRGKYAIDWQGNNALSQSNITTKSFTQDNVPVGVYTINVKDETNCVSTHKVTIASGNLKVSHKETEASCSSIGNARAEIAVSGAKLPVTYKWSDNVETPDPVRNNLTNGNYVVTVVDQNNCSMPVDIKIYSKKLSTATAIDSATCGLDPDGAAEIRLFSATSPFTFTWPDGKITSESKRSGLDKGNYDVLITDANGCEVHANVAIPHKGYLQNDVPSSINLCYNGEITVDANEFDGYEWICNGWVVDNNRFLTVKSPGTYIVKANGYDDCYAVDTISVTMSPTSFSPYFRMSSVSYINDTLVVMEMSQTNPDKYSWKYDTLAFDCDNSKGSERELRLIPKLSGIYSVTLSAENQDCVSDISKPVEIFATVRPDDEFSPLYVDNSIVKAFNLSPNPTKGPITVEVNLSQISDVRLTIYDLNFGKIRKQVTLRNSDNYKLDINDVISTGAYVVILQTGNETKQIKYIVSR